MTLYVQAHTNEVGSKSLSELNPWFSRYRATGSIQTHAASAIRDRSYKSESKDGSFHPSYPGFRRATEYRRLIGRARSLASPNFTTFDSGLAGPRAVYDYWGESSVHPSGVYWGIIPGIAWGTGTVTCSANLVNRARTEALLKLADQKVNLGEALAELRSTVNMVSKAISTLVKAFRALRSGNYARLGEILVGKKGSRNRSRSPDNAWLSYQYGWMPLISDIWGGVEQIREGFRKNNLLFHVERTVSEPMNTRDFVAPAGNVNISTSGWAEQSVKVVLWGSISAATWAAGAQLGLINPAAIAWAVVPYSFVIDWLVPIGNWLESLTATAGVSFVDGSQVSMIKGKVKGKHNRPGVGSHPQRTGVLPEAEFEVMAMQRIVFTTWPGAFLYWKNPLSTTHLASALALLRQRS